MFYDTLSAPPCFIVYLIGCDHSGVVAGGDERQELLPDLASYGALQEIHGKIMGNLWENHWDVVTSS